MQFPPPAPASRFASVRRPVTAAFTIAEVMMSTFVLALGIATSVIAMQSGFKQIDVARGTTLASQIIQSEMERLRMMPWSKITGGSPEPVDSISELPATATFDGATYFSSNADLAGKYSITRTAVVDSTRPTEIMNITVSVRWQSYDLRWHQRSFTAMYAKSGLYDYYYTVAHP
jgi:Tfp pilus assembly protein PilV